MKKQLRQRTWLTKKYLAILGISIGCFILSAALMAQENATQMNSAGLNAVKPDHSGQKWVIVIHGGAGGPAKGTIPEDKEKAYMDKLGEALKLGSELLAHGKSSVDVVEAVIEFMEDCPLFNAGKGAVLNEIGNCELDAAIMDGRTCMAGAVAGVTTIKNPVAAARMVMDHTNHVMLVGKGAEEFAKNTGLKIVDPAYFITTERLEAWKKWKETAPPGIKDNPATGEKHGTVGAVALDLNGDLAAATSTGGMTGKMAGRVGDSPIIGAGTYANNKTCAVSATGHGEYFIRNVVAFDLSAMMEYGNKSLEEAAKTIVMEKLLKQEATGGLIAVDRQGNVAMPFNTNAMFRGVAKSTGEFTISIY